MSYSYTWSWWRFLPPAPEGYRIPLVTFCSCRSCKNGHRPQRLCIDLDRDREAPIPNRWWAPFAAAAYPYRV